MKIFKIYKILKLYYVHEKINIFHYEFLIIKIKNNNINKS